MTSLSQHHDLDSPFANQFVTLRTTLGLTQATLAQQLGVTERAIQRWEAGTRSPKADTLKSFLALCFEHHAFPVGREVEQARLLWKAARLKVLFDEHWIRSLLDEQVPQRLEEEQKGGSMPNSIAQRLDWGEDVAEVSFYGRESEQAQLTTWIREDRCRLIALLGMGGIGKSALAVKLMHQLAPFVTVAVFRSVRNAIPCEDLVTDLIQVLAPEPIGDIPSTLDLRVTLLLKLMQMRRCLVVLDNIETLLQEGEHSGQYRVGYEVYGRLLERIGTTQHQSCVILTSREKPNELKLLEGSHTPVRSLHLTGLEEDAGEQILREKQLRGVTEAKRRLINAYSGNPLALKIVAETIRDLFAGEIAPFLAEGQIIFQGVRALLAQQFARLTFLEQSVLLWLAIVREPTDVKRLRSLFVAEVPRLQLLEAIEALRRRSLVEHGQQRSTFTLQSVVMEYVTDELVKHMTRDVQNNEPDYLLTYALSLASAKEYIRQAQERLIIAPILAQLGAIQHRKHVVEQQLRNSLDLLRVRSLDEQGYGPTNITMLLNQLIGNLQGVDLSGCVLREAYLQGAQMQDASLRGAFVQASTFTETFGIVTAVAVNSNGSSWATGCDTGDVRIFLGEGNISSLMIHAHNSVAAIAFSPDGTRLVTGGRDSLVKVWNLEHVTMLATLQGHSKIIQSIAFSPDGTRLATGALDGTVCIWDSVSFQMLRLLDSHEQGLSKIAWSPDGLLLASAGDDSIRLWSFQNEVEGRTLEDNGNTIFGLAFSPDSRLLVSGGTDQLVKVWDVASEKCLESLRGHTATVVDIAWSPDGYLLASGSYDTTVRLWHAKPIGAQQVLLGHIDGVQSVAFTADGTTLLSGGEDRSVRLWETASGDCIRLMQGYTLSCYSVAWHPQSEIVAAAMSDARIMLWNPTKAKLLHVLQGHTQAVYTVAWSPDGQLLASGSADQTIRLWDASTGECLSVLQYHLGNVKSIAWSPSGSMLVSGGFHDGMVCVWNREKWTHRWVNSNHFKGVLVVAWSPDEIYIASGGDDATMRLWNAEDGTLLRIFKGHKELVNNIAWSPDGKRLASCAGAEIYIWDVASEILLHTLHESSRIVVVAWSPKGNKLLAGGNNGIMSWWETENWTCLAVRKEHRGNVRSISISSDGRTAASADHDGIIIIWDMEQVVPLHTLRPDRPYERLDISGIQGITEAQKTTLRALGAVED